MRRAGVGRRLPLWNWLWSTLACQEGRWWGRQLELPPTLGWFLFWWNLAFQFLHGFKLFHFVHRFQNCFCFRSTTFPSAVRTFGQWLLVLHCNYNGAVAPKFDLVITFDWGVVSTQGQCVWTAFCKIFSGIPHSPISGAPKYACQKRQICQIQPIMAKYGI